MDTAEVFNEWRLRFSSDADIVRLTNARIIIIIIIINRTDKMCISCSG